MNFLHKYPKNVIFLQLAGIILLHFAFAEESVFQEKLLRMDEHRQAQDKIEVFENTSGLCEK